MSARNRVGCAAYDGLAIFGYLMFLISAFACVLWFHSVMSAPRPLRPGWASLIVVTDVMQRCQPAEVNDDQNR